MGSGVILKRGGGAPYTTRTCDLRYRKPMLYPTELRTQKAAKMRQKEYRLLGDENYGAFFKRFCCRKIRLLNVFYYFTRRE